MHANRCQPSLRAPQITPRIKNVENLASAEIFLLRSFRYWISGLKNNAPHHWSLVWNDFAKRFGAADAKTALCGFFGVMKALQTHARRKVRHYPACCSHITGDEEAMVAFFSACQKGDWNLARRKGEWLLQEDGIGDCLLSAGAVTGIMTSHNLMLPDRTLGGPGVSPQRARTREVAIVLGSVA